MATGRKGGNGSRRAVLAWIGLLLMAASLVWMQFLPNLPESSLIRLPAIQEPFRGVVVLDPGHGGNDSGTMCAGLLEKDVALDVAKRLQRLVQAQGFNVKLTRVGDQFVSLANRAAFANAQADCIFVSIHFNEGPRQESSGVETYYASHAAMPGLMAWLPFLNKANRSAPNFQSQSLAGFIQNALVSRTQAPNRGTKVEQFYVIANVRHPAVLVEGGFLTNKTDAVKLATADYRERLASAICEGILRYRDAARSHPPALAVSAPGVE